MQKLIYSALILVGLSTSAQAAADWVFTITNKSATTIDRFRTQEDGVWSSSWLTNHIEPSDTFNMHFGHADGDCSVRTQIGFEDNTFFDVDVDYCQVEHMDIYEKRITWK